MSNDVDYCLDEFSRLFKSVIDFVAPVCEIRVKQRSNPWMNSHILAGIRERDKLLSQFKRNKDSSLYDAYCKVRNSVQRDIKRAKANYFLNKVKQSSGNSDKLWRLLKSLGYSSSCSTSKIVLEDNGS